jgi:CubicO group peptidase (beta-lactamase class C family)
MENRPASGAAAPPSAAIDAMLRREIDLGSFASAVYAVGDGGRLIAEGAAGNAVAVPLRIPATRSTIYDCASITKALITATLALQELSIDDKVHGYSVRELLTHTSGLRAWMPLYAYPDPLRAIVEEGPEAPRGGRVIYSDLNFVLLWMAIDRFAEKARERIFAPLGIAEEAMLHPPAELRPRIAATEWGQRYEARMCAERNIRFEGARQGLIWGETHDGNSHFLGRGCAGNAGLFATARSVLRIAAAILGGELLPREIVEEAVRNQTPGEGDARGWGWQLGTGSPATEMLSPGSFGHTGFTGTSVWIDHASGRIMVLLTNRVHPCAAPVAIQKIRGEFHRLALQL